VQKLCVLFICASFLILRPRAGASDPSHLLSSLPLAAQAGTSADAGMRPPLVADPWAQMAKLTASLDQSGLFFGTSVAISGDTVVIGQTDAGQALVFIKPKSGWRNMTQTATLIPSDGNGCTFGASVAISGDTIVVGESKDAWWCSQGPGAAYVFVKPAGGWSGTLTQTAKLTASDGATGDALGASISVSGSTVVSGAPGIYPFGTPGGAYVFVKPASGWVNGNQTAKLTASDGQTGDQLGYSVSISSNTVVAGAPLATVGAIQAPGAMYVFMKPAGGWANSTQTAKLSASDGRPNDYLGYSVSADGNTVLGGARFAAGRSNGGDGAAYVYVEPPGGWTNMHETAKLTTTDDGVAALGFSVALDDNIAVAGAPYINYGQNFAGGAAYVFVKPKSGWATGSSKTKLVGSDAKFSAEMGSSIAVDGHTVVAGAPAINRDTGAAYVFWQP
jgi:FG-GAP repeat